MKFSSSAPAAANTRWSGALPSRHAEAQVFVAPATPGTAMDCRWSNVAITASRLVSVCPRRRHRLHRGRPGSTLARWRGGRLRAAGLRIFGPTQAAPAGRSKISPSEVHAQPRHPHRRLPDFHAMPPPPMPMDAKGAHRGQGRRPGRRQGRGGGDDRRRQDERARRHRRHAEGQQDGRRRRAW